MAEYEATQRATAADATANDNLARGMVGNAAEELAHKWANSTGRTKDGVLKDTDEAARNVAEDRPKPRSRRPGR